MIVVPIIALILTALFCHFVLFNREVHMGIFKAWNPEGHRLIREHENTKSERQDLKITSYSVKVYDHYCDYHRAMGPFEALTGTKQEVLHQLLSGVQPYKGLDAHGKELFESQKARLYTEINELEDHQCVIVLAENVRQKLKDEYSATNR